MSDSNLLLLVGSARLTAQPMPIAYHAGHFVDACTQEPDFPLDTSHEASRNAEHYATLQAASCQEGCVGLGLMQASQRL